MLDGISRFRRFARAVTTELGVLDNSFLGRGRPLGVARVITAIGHGRVDIAELRDYLRLDSGLMSRMLRALEAEGLVEVATHPQDGRRRVASLTAAGERECSAYDTISNERADALLSRHRRAGELLAAMDMIASALSADQVVIIRADPRDERSRYCLEKYYRELAQVFEGGFEVERSRDPQADLMVPPHGAFLLAISDGLPVGCVGVKGSGGGACEIKRLWVSPSERGLGLGRRLMAEAEAAARGLSITKLRLDTNRALPEAINMYRRSGWTEIERFNDDPYADFFFEKTIDPAAAAPASTG